jgi:hypothetical protein
MKKLLLILTGLSLFILSCSKGDVLPIDDLASGPKIVGFKKTVESVAYFSDEGTKEIAFPISLIGYGNGQLSTTDITLEYEIDVAKTTAINNVEYSLVDTSKRVIIPAGTDFGNLKINVNTGQLNATSKTELVLKLKSVDGTAISESQKSLKIVFVGCKTNLARNYTASNGKPATVTKTAPNVYRSTYLPTFAASYWFDFTDVCGELEIIDWQFQGSNPITRTGGGNVKGYISPTGALVFEKVNVGGVGFYVNLTWSLN